MPTSPSDISLDTLPSADELQWAEAHGVRVVRRGDADYPTRLLPLPDAPAALFVRGDADLNPIHSLAVVGTRNITQYGMDVIDRLMRDLAQLCPDVQIVSGLAYGVDIRAHRCAMQHGLATIGVVAHGHDMLYPAAHRRDAAQMLATGHGAVVTEYPHGTRPLPPNFLARNRIIAAMSDAVIVIESADHGGSLVTARRAREYGREVFAVPGSILSPASEGCNTAIMRGEARLLTSAADIMQVLGWTNAAQQQAARRSGIERQLFPDLTPDEQRLLDYLRAHGDSRTNDIATQLALPVSAVASALFSLEMKGMVRALPGNNFHLVE